MKNMVGFVSFFSHGGLKLVGEVKRNPATGDLETVIKGLEVKGPEGTSLEIDGSKGQIEGVAGGPIKVGGATEMQPADRRNLGLQPDI